MLNNTSKQISEGEVKVKDVEEKKRQTFEREFKRHREEEGESLEGGKKGRANNECTVVAEEVDADGGDNNDDENDEDHGQEEEND
jgi:hypothetical protein